MNYEKPLTTKQLEAQRPGCQDFLKCPSREGDKLKEYMPPRIDCVGELADKTSNAR